MKILATDYDGTLRHHDGISEKDRAAIIAWRNNGNLFGIVTGRGCDMPNIVAEDGIDVDFIIAYNGADIYDSRGSIIKRFLGNTERLYELLPLILRKSGDWAEIVTPDREYLVTYNNESPNSRNSSDTWVNQECIREVKQFIQIYSLYGSEEETLAIAKQLNDRYGDVVSALVNVKWLNATPSGVNKATGVQEYSKLMSVANENIYTIGDSYNDWDMIKAFNGFTVENGADGIKKIARAVYRGVWELIYTFN